MAAPSDDYLVSHFIHKTVPFKFRGIIFCFDLSQGLFSSDNVDSGTQLLLYVLSRALDDDEAEGKPPPRRVLDAGCGVGVIGICAAATMPGAYVRCQDRDELARLVTLYNAAKNGIAPSTLEAFAEPLLAGPPPWDLILSNIPAKAGPPVLEDFVRRSARLLSPGGRVMIVVVHTLADFFRAQIAAAGAELVLEKKVQGQGPGHSVFVYGGATAGEKANEAFATDGSFLERHPSYARTAAACRIEDIDVRIETIHGASGFDAPGGAVLAAARLAHRIGLQKLIDSGGGAVLVHEPGQGFFPCWLLEYLGQPRTLVLSGRNILALEAARHNVPNAVVIPAVDLWLGRAALLEAGAKQAAISLTVLLQSVNKKEAAPRYSLIAAFPELLPQKPLSKKAGDSQAADQLAALWDSLPPLLADEGIFIAAFGSSDAERFDRKKPAGFDRLGSIKRDGFRALAYRKRYSP